MPGAVWSNLAGKPEFAVDVTTEGVANDGMTNVTAAIQSVVDEFGGVSPIRFPAGRYVLGDGSVGTNRITMPSGTALLCDPGAVFVVNQIDSQSGTSVFATKGSDGTKTNLDADADSGDQTVVLPVGYGAGFSVGDIIGFECLLEVGDYAGGPHYARETHAVVDVSTDTVQLDIPLEYDYATSDTAQFWKMTMVDDIVIDGAVFETGPQLTAGTDGTYPIRLVNARNFKLNNIQIRNMTGGIALYDCYEGYVTDPVIEGLPSYADSYGYGIFAAGSTTFVSIDNPHISDNRHAFTTISDARVGDEYWGGPMHIQINNGIGYGSPDGYSIWDTHEFGRHIQFNNCQAIGGGSTTSGFQQRAQDITMSNCRGIGNGIRGAQLVTNSKRVTIEGGEYAFAAHQGISCSGDQHQILGARVHDNAGAGISSNVSTCIDLLVVGAIVEDNLYGFQDAGAAGSVDTRLIGCIVPKPASSGVISFLALSDTTVITDAVCLGYGVNASTGIPSAGMQSPAAGSVWSVITDGGRVNSSVPIVGTVNNQAGTTYTLALADGGQVVTLTNAAAITLTVPANASVAIPVGTTTSIAAMGAGTVTIAAASGVALRRLAGLSTIGQYSRVTLMKTGVNTWVASGDLT